MNWYFEALKKYAVISGRARRKEYWYFVLFSVIIAIILANIDNALGLKSMRYGIGALSSIYILGMIVPSIAVTIRRLHDIDKCGCFYFIILIPIIGAFILFIYSLTRGTVGANTFGEDPIK